MSVKLTFLGGVGTVTGSKYLLEKDGTRVLVATEKGDGIEKCTLFRVWGDASKLRELKGAKALS